MSMGRILNHLLKDAKTMVSYGRVGGFAAISQVVGSALVNPEVPVETLGDAAIVTGLTFGVIHGSLMAANNHGLFAEYHNNKPAIATIAFLEYLASIGISYSLLTSLGSSKISLGTMLAANGVGFPLTLGMFVLGVALYNSANSPTSSPSYRPGR